MQTRTTVLLDDSSRRAAKILAAKLDISPSEAIRRALVHYRQHVLGAAPETRRRRKRTLERLSRLFEGHDAESEVERLKDEDAFF